MFRRSLAAAMLWSGICAATALVALAEPARLGIDAPASGPLESGSVVGISWSLEGGGAEGGADVDMDMDEMELVLSLDGGRSFPLRVTRRIAPTERGWSWTVPALPTANGRLGLRAGRDERSEEERLLLVSAAFAITVPAGAAPEETYRVGDEERTRDALEAPPLPRLPASMREVPDRMASEDALDLPARPSGAGAAPARSGPPRDDESKPLAPPSPGGSPVRSTVPLPLRL